MVKIVSKEESQKLTRVAVIMLVLVLALSMGACKP